MKTNFEQLQTMIDKALVKVEMHGLGIICFNDNLQRCEIGYLREKTHNLTLSIKKVSENNSDEEVITYKIGKLSDLSINLYATKGNLSYEKFMISEEFSRANYKEENKNDIRWLVDVENDVHKEEMLPVDTSMILTPMFIKNSLFYSDELGKSVQKWNQNADVDNIKPDNFGMVCKVFGALLDGEKVSLKIKSDGNSFTHVFSKQSKVRFKIVIENLENEDDKTLTGDMKYYYQVFKPATDSLVNLTTAKDFQKLKEIKSKENNDEIIPKSVGKSTVCHFAMLGRTNTINKYLKGAEKK